MELKKILLLITLSLFYFGNCQASRHKISDEENCCSSSFRKLSSGFSCLFGDFLETSTRHHYKKIYYDKDNEIEELASLENQPIILLPNEVLYKIIVILSPSDIVSLIKSNKQLSCLRSNNFWLYYNKENNYSSWNEEFTGIQVAFSYYWFRNNQIRKAAAMGLPRACEFLKQQEKLKRENSQIYGTWSYPREYVPRPHTHRMYM